MLTLKENLLFSTYRNIRNAVDAVLVGVGEDGCDAEADEDYCPDDGDDAGGDEPGDDHAHQHRGARAHRVAQTPACSRTST